MSTFNPHWLYTIKLRISEEQSWQANKNLCNDAISEIKRITPLIEQSKIDNKDVWSLQLQDILSDFEMRLLDEGDLELEDSIDEINYILENLYDLADISV